MPEMVVIAASIAQKPGYGGHTWVFLQYLLGLKRLGWEVVLLDRLDPTMCRDASGRPCSPEQSVNLRYFTDVMKRFGFNDSFSLLCDADGTEVVGLSRSEVLERTRNAAFLLNVMGFLQDVEILGAAQRRVFLDIDPGFGQMWCHLDLHDPFRNHDVLVTVGQNVGDPDCAIPDCGRQWIPTFPPVVLDEWPVAEAPAHARITTVASWRGAYGPIDYNGTTYGLRVHEFRNFLELPCRSGRPFEVALDIHPADGADIDRLADNGWSIIDPRQVAGDPRAYRRYIQSSLAEFSVAKEMYVKTGSGWFSDRSACYLASGRPVIAQDTGFTSVLPSGTGLLAFSTPDEAMAAVESLERDIDRHRRHAREIAQAYFDSDIVLPKLLSELAVARPVAVERAVN